MFQKNFFKNYQIPTFSGGGTVEFVSEKKTIYLQNIEETENAGTPGILQLVRASEAYDLRNKIGFEFIKKKGKRTFEILFRKNKKYQRFCFIRKK